MQTSKLVLSQASWKTKAVDRSEEACNLRKCLKASYRCRDRWKAKAKVLEKRVAELEAELEIKKS